MAVSLVLVDDHPFVLGGLEQLLRAEPDFEVLATCGSLDEGWEAVSRHKPDVVVLDLDLRRWLSSRHRTRRTCCWMRRVLGRAASC
jgi:DNA-binding NarL/FixJ family response regulator